MQTKPIFNRKSNSFLLKICVDWVTGRGVSGEWGRGMGMRVVELDLVRKYVFLFLSLLTRFQVLTAMLNSVVAVLLVSVSSDVAAAIPQCKSGCTVPFFSKKVSFSLLLFFFFFFFFFYIFWSIEA